MSIDAQDVASETVMNDDGSVDEVVQLKSYKIYEIEKW